MNTIKQLMLLGFALAAAASVSAATVSTDDIVKMHRAGVNEEILIKTIEANAPPANLRQQDLESLKREGVSDRVIGALQKKLSTEAPVAPAAPQAAVSTAAPANQAPAPAPEVVRANPVPVYVNPAPTYIYAVPPPPPPYYYYGPRYYYDPWYPPVTFSFGYYRHHHHH